MLDLIFVVLISSILSIYSAPLHPSRFFVSTTIDVSSDEVVREGLRLLQSIRSFGGKLNDATLEVGIARAANEPISNKLLRKLEMLNITHIRCCDAVKAPEYSPTLNKFCSFHTIPLEDYDYIWMQTSLLHMILCLFSSHFSSYLKLRRLMCIAVDLGM